MHDTGWLGCMFLISYVDHRFLRKMVVPGYIIVLAMLAVTLTMAPLNGCRRWIRFWRAYTAILRGGKV